MPQIGEGILTWASYEKITRRYGQVTLGGITSQGDVRGIQKWNEDVLWAMEGQWVKLWALVLESRGSGHRGDVDLGLTPSAPEVGETIVLGVGELTTYKSPWGDRTGFPSYYVGLRPAKHRSELWMDPRNLYRLHDQVVQLCADYTDLPAHTVAPFPHAPAADQDI